MFSNQNLLFTVWHYIKPYKREMLHKDVEHKADDK